MHAMPHHSAAVSRLAEAAIELTSAITGMARTLIDAVHAGSTRGRDPHEEPARRRYGRDVEHEERVRHAPLRGRRVEERGQHGEGQHADEHLPCDEVQGVERMLALEVLGRDRAGRPPEAGEDRPQLGAEVAAPVPRLDDERKPRHRRRDGDPLDAANALVQDRPRDEQCPERHREHEHRRAARTAAGERHGGRGEVHGGLEKSGDDDGEPRRGPQRAPLHDERDEEHEHREPRALHVEHHRRRVLERELHHDPVEAPRA